MTRGREYLQSIEAKVFELADRSDAELQVVRDQLEAIDRAMPSTGDFVCKHCAQRLVITARVVTRDGESAHCSRNGGKHEPAFV